MPTIQATELPLQSFWANKWVKSPKVLFDEEGKLEIMAEKCTSGLKINEAGFWEVFTDDTFRYNLMQCADLPSGWSIISSRFTSPFRFEILRLQNSSSTVRLYVFLSYFENNLFNSTQLFRNTTWCSLLDLTWRSEASDSNKSLP